MKKILIGISLLLVLLPAIVSAATYYIDATAGNDANLGTSQSNAWKTISKVNSATFSPGDQILFKRGETWRETLIIDDTGEAENPIIFKGYGSGSKPIIQNTSGNYYNIIRVTGGYITIDGLQLKDLPKGYGIELQGIGHNLINNVEISNVTIGVDVNSKFNLINNSYFHDMYVPSGQSWGANGIAIKNTNTEVSYNRFLNCKYRSDFFGFDGGAIELFGTVDNTNIHHNWAMSNNGWLEAGSSQWDPEPGTAYNVTIAYNVLINNLAFLSLHNDVSDRTDEPIIIDDWNVYHNTIVDFGTEGSMGWVYIGFTVSPSPNTISLKNNIFYIDNYWFVSACNQRGWNFTHQYNLYYLPDPASSVGCALSACESIQNPKFINLLGYDFHLASDSPAIDAGANLGFTRDYEGNAVPQGSAPDIGAYEYVSTTRPTTYYVKTKGFDVNANYTTIKGFNITATDDYWDDGVGIFAQGHHNIIENNYIYYSVMGGIELYADPANPNKTSYCIVRNNKLNRNGMIGIDVAGRNNLIEGNEVWDTIQHHPGHAGNESWLDADGMHFFGSGHVYRKNYIHDIKWEEPWNVNPHTDCFQTWSATGFEASSNILFEQNYCDITTAIKWGQGWQIEPATDGSGTGRSRNLTMRNNIIKVFRELNANGVDGITVVGNTFLNDPSFIAYPNQGGIGCSNCTNVVVKNNILYDMINHPICFHNTGYEQVQVGGNLEYRSDGQSLWTNDEWCHYNATMRARALWGVNPQFVNVGAKDYHLQASSPDINAGLSLGTLLTNDYENNARPQGAGYDIGAFEYQGGISCAASDINCDTKVDLSDLNIVASDFGKTSGLNNAKSDTNNDGIVDIYDVVYVASRIA